MCLPYAWGEELQDPLNYYFLAPLALGAILTILLVNIQISILYALTFSVFIGLLTGETGLFIYSLAGSFGGHLYFGPSTENGQPSSKGEPWLAL